MTNDAAWPEVEPFQIARKMTKMAKKSSKCAKSKAVEKKNVEKKSVTKKEDTSTQAHEMPTTKKTIPGGIVQKAANFGNSDHYHNCSFSSPLVFMCTDVFQLFFPR